MKKIFFVLLALTLGYTIPMHAQTCNFSVQTQDASCAGSNTGQATVMLNGTPFSTTSGAPVSTPSTCLSALTSTDCSNCPTTITSSQNITVQGGARVCIKGTSAFTGGITFDTGGGTLVICNSNATISWMNFNTTTSAITVIVTGQATFTNLNAQSNVTVKNYGTIICNGASGFMGVLENHGTFRVTTGDLSINSSGGLINRNTIEIQNGSFNNYNTNTNSGTITVSGNFVNNGGSQFINECTITAGGDLNNSTPFINKGNATVGGMTRINGSSSYQGYPGSRLNTKDFQSDATVQGGSTGCAAIKVTGITTLNTSSVLSGNIDLCDANGIETRNGSITGNASTNCSCQGAIVWSNNQQGGINPLTNLAPGNYSVTVYPSVSGCSTDTLNFTIGAPSALTLSVQVNGMTAVATAGGGTPPYTYTWNGGSGTGNTRTFVNSGTYHVTVTDSKGCSRQSDPIVIGDVPNPPCTLVNVNYTSDKKVIVTCDCPGPCALVTNTGTLPPGTAVNLPANDSIIVVRPSSGPDIPVTVEGNNRNPGNNPVNLQVTYTSTPATSTGQNNGSAVITVTGGSGDYTFVNSSTTQSGTNNTGTITLSNLPGGTTQVTVKDNKTGATVVVDVEIPTTPPNGVTIVTNSSYPDGTPSSVSVVVTPPSGTATGPYAYNWVVGGTPSGNTSSGPVTVPSGGGTTGTVCVTVTDALGRVITECIPTVPTCTTSFTPAFSLTEPSCHGSSNGQIAITNLPANTTVQWSGGSSVVSGATASSLRAGTYRATVTQTLSGGQKCTLYSDHVTLAEPAPLALIVTGGNNNNNYTASATGGTSPYSSFSWSTGATTPTVTINTKGLYYVNVTDNHGCTVRRDFLVPELRCTGTIGLTPTHLTCPGANDGAIVSTFSGSGASWYWSGAGIPAAASRTGTSISGLPEGTYFLSVRQSASGCLSYAGISVGAPEQLKAYYQAGSGNAVSIVVEGGTPNYTVKWRQDNLVAETRTDLTIGSIYTVDITDSKGCTFTYTFRYDLCGDNPVSVYVLVNGNNADPVVSGGVGGLTYLWTTTTTGVTIANPASASQTGLPNGNYKLTVTDANGCRAEANLQLPNCGLTVTLSQTTAPSCSTLCNGKATAAVTPMNAGTLILWNEKTLSKDLLNACAGTHEARVTTSGGCAVEKTITLTPAMPVCTTGTPGGSCTENPVNVSERSRTEKTCFTDESYVDLLVQGGLAPFTYTWTGPFTDDGSDTTIVSDKEDLEDPLPGSYTLLITDVRGCTKETNVTVNGPSSRLRASAEIRPAPCVGASDTVTISAQGGKAPYTFAWPGGSTASMRTDLTPGVYQVAVTDAAGCTDTVTVSLTAPVFHGEIFYSQLRLCPGEEAILTAARVPGYSYNWSGPGVTAPYVQRSLTTTTTGTYTLQYLRTGCTTQSVNVTVVADTGCNRKSIICTPIELIDVPFDPKQSCIDQQMLAAEAHGTYRYKVYLEEAKRKFKADYISNVLTYANEALSMEYTDKEQHYTLYYYDQAGNLVRTVPPAGVKPLSDDEVTQAETEIGNSSPTVFTGHDLATTYRYNSLNQLVAQDVPDNRRQDIWETTTTNITLATGQEVKAFVYTGSGGTLFANTSGLSEIYRSSDGGKTWEPYDNLNIPEIIDLQKVTDLVAYGVGYNGIFIKSEDGGLNWVMKTVPTGDNLVRVYFTSATSGLIMSETGSIWTTSDGGDNWSTENASLKQQNPGAVRDAWFDGTSIWAVSDDWYGGVFLWYSSGAGNTTWTQQFFKAGTLNSLLSDGSSYMAAGPAGALFTLGTDGRIHTTRTDLAQGIQQLLKTGNLYYAVGQDGKLYWSGSVTQWSAASAQGNVVQVISGPGKEIAVTSDARTGESSAWGTFAATNVSGLTQATRIRYTSSTLFSGQSSAGYGYVVLAGNKVAYRAAADNFGTSAGWTEVTITGLGTGEKVTDLWVFAPGTWTLLTDAGKLYKTSSTAINTLSATLLFSNVRGIYPSYPSGTPLYYATTSGSISYSSDGITWTSAGWSSLSDAASLSDMIVEPGATPKALATFSNGTLRQLNGTGWSEISGTLQPSQLFGIQARLSDGMGYAAGNNSEIYKRNGNAWEYLPHTSSGLNFSDLAVTGDNVLHLSAGSAVYSYAPSALTLEADLGDGIARISAEGTALGAVTWAGRIFERPSAVQPWNLTYVPANDYTGWAIDMYTDGSNIAAIRQGGNMKMYEKVSGIWDDARTIRPMPLYAASSGTGAGSTPGIAVGKKGTMIMTTDMGNTWKPRYSGTSSDLTCISSSSSGILAGGPNGTLISSYGGYSWAAPTVTPPLSSSADVDAVASGGQAMLAVAGTRLIRSTDYGSTFTDEPALPATGRALWLDQYGYGFIAGDQGMAIRIEPNGNNYTFTYTSIASDADLTDDKGSGIPAGASLRTVYFTDRLTGYLTGANGLVLKTVDGGYHWKQESGGSGTGTPVVGVSQDGVNGTIVNADGSVSALKDRAETLTSRFWYDELGRLTLSQNSRQYNIESYLTTAQISAVPGTGTVHAYSYTLYDDIGRIIEVGELLTRSTPPQGKHETQVVYGTVQGTFVNSGVKREITRTWYDEVKYPGIVENFKQEHLRPRVASVTYQDQEGAAYDRATHYSYDVHGNVKSLVQEVKGVQNTTLVKRLDYDYDLVSGKVNYVYYQKDHPDQFIHKYEYDGDNRITRVLTSRDGIVWEQDAKYQYYGHGPLARRETGGEKVETADYAYTLQGWMKALSGQNFSYGLGYFSGDYQGIGSTAGLQNAPVAKSLYNGNIATMTTHTPALSGTALTQQFEYDQLNRIMSSKVAGGTNTDSYRTGYTYDANGNILTMDRYAGNGTRLDQLAYHYELKGDGYRHNTNRLRWVDELAGVTTGDNSDLEDQAADNYDYDDIGNLQHDETEEIENIEWNVYGKVKKVTRTSGSTKPDLEFFYDATGNRVAKKVTEKSGNVSVTYYFRDASGNVMSVYRQESAALPVTLAENHIYGSSRVGIRRADPSAEGLPITGAVITGSDTKGFKDYELTDHLGDVRAVISDLRAVNGAVSVTSASDYYPFGMVMPGRSIVDPNGYRYGFNGQERDVEINTDVYSAQFWEYDAKLARRWNLDQIRFAWQSPYATFNNNPIYYSDPTGLTGEGPEPTKHTTKSGDTYGKLAKQYGVTVEQLRQWNGFADNKIPTGANLIVSDPEAVKQSDLSKMGIKPLVSASQVMKQNVEVNGNTSSVNASATALPLLFPAAAEGMSMAGWAEGLASVSAVAGPAVFLFIPGDTPLRRTTTQVGYPPIAVPYTGTMTRTAGENIVYQMFSIDPVTGNFQTLKYGISGQDDFATKDGNPRPEYQTNVERAKDPTKIFGYTILFVTTNRQVALNVEQALVDAYYITHGQRPPLQKRPLATIEKVGGKIGNFIK